MAIISIWSLVWSIGAFFTRSDALPHKIPLCVFFFFFGQLLLRSAWGCELTILPPGAGLGSLSVSWELWVAGCMPACATRLSVHSNIAIITTCTMLVILALAPRDSQPNDWKLTHWPSMLYTLSSYTVQHVNPFHCVSVVRFHIFSSHTKFKLAKTPLTSFNDIKRVRVLYCTLNSIF